uniref:Methyltransferase n=1 Tax=Candidatus Kentrum sp. LPFa TaxID=2126335 RepID=A0A450WV09_9GAMM|nr:MAG: site-specific DNA-methyltransferase (adenine-specific) [Candidatus Kentron sp. LPFa]
MNFVHESEVAPGKNQVAGITESTILRGDAERLLARLPSAFFRCCVTSPPYWGLRDYRTDDQIGAEDSPDDYVDRLVAVFDRVRRVLTEDGTLWLNVGDSYTSGNRGYRAPDKKNPVRAMSYRARTPEGLKPKDLIGIPWRLAFALQEAGWYLRTDIIWEKPNCMPESVKDRPTRSHETIFLLSKSLKYYYDHASAREINGRNRRTVWSIPTEPFPGAHFATFPCALVEPCIMAGSKAGDWVLDPFFGSGTVGVVCEQQHRNYVGIELNPEYVDLATQRIRNTERLLFPYDMECAG